MQGVVPTVDKESKSGEEFCIDDWDLHVDHHKVPGEAQQIPKF
jgi:hypothetical protein